MHGRPARPALVHEPPPREEIGHRARRGPVANARVRPPERGEELPRAPMGVRDALEHEQLLHRRLDLVRAMLRHVAAIGQARPAFGLVPHQPLVPDPPADAVAGAELTHGEVLALGIAYKPESLVHRSTLLPWHRCPR